MKTIEQTIKQVIDAAITEEPGKAERSIMQFVNQHNIIVNLEAERLEWSLKTFSEATPISSLRKLEGEIKEVEQHLEVLGLHNESELTEEFADCLMCLFDSAGRAGILPNQIFAAFEVKLQKNKARNWAKNADNSYSHVKS